MSNDKSIKVKLTKEDFKKRKLKAAVDNLAAHMDDIRRGEDNSLTVRGSLFNIKNDKKRRDG